MTDAKIADVHDKATSRADEKHAVAQHKLDDHADAVKHRADEKAAVNSELAYTQTEYR